MMWKVAVVSFIGSALADNYTFNQSEFHADEVMGKSSIKIHDYFHFTGHLSEDGGNVTAQCANDTSTRTCSHSMTFGKEFIEHVPALNLTYPARNVTALIEGKFMQGEATFGQDRITGQKYMLGIEYELADGFIYLERGPSVKPAPPPPPPKCTDEFTRAGCEALGKQSCAWCESSDGMHQLCFVKDHIPSDAEGWSCGKAAVAKFV